MRSEPLASSPAPAAAAPAAVTFLFPGIGDEYPNMGRQLYAEEPVFRAAVDDCATILAPSLDLDIRRALYPDGAPGPAGAGLDLRRMVGRGAAGARALPAPVAHSILFAVEVGLARLWLSRGLRPAALIGYSLGEYAAACVAGVFGLADALRLVAHRARLVEAQPPGVMLAVSLSETELRPMLAGLDIDLAVVSGPAMCVAAGPPDAMARLEARLAGEEIPARRIDTARALHSRLMAPVARDFLPCVEPLALDRPAIPILSNVTGTWLTDDEARSPSYWARHLVHTVRFADGLRTALAVSRVFVEVGPGQTLGVLVRLNAGRAGRCTVVPSLPSQYDDQPDRDRFLHSAGLLRAAGLPVEVGAP